LNPELKACVEQEASLDASQLQLIIDQLKTPVFP
jgi:hypothetical protein